MEVLALYGKTVGEKNSHGDWVTTDGFIKNILVDIQPYNTEMLKKNYGYDIEVSNRIFYDHFGIDTDIKINYILKTLEEVQKEYEIRKFIPWDTYMDIFVYRIK
jgi:hypothetical protein